MQIRLLQTASGQLYREMLEATERLHGAFCERHGIEFVLHIGVKRGAADWQATFNRIDLLAEMVAEEYRGWVLYVDADALIRQPDFPIRDYLSRHADKALIAVPGTATAKWDINAGVMFVNLGHPHAPEIIQRWQESFYRIVTDQMLAETIQPWGALPDGKPFPDDQHLLQMVLLHHPHLLDTLYLESVHFMNYGGGTFIRQVIRDGNSDRVATLRTMVAAADADETPTVSLPAIADRFGTAKGTLKGRGERYASTYEPLFAPHRMQRFAMLEIGLSDGGPECAPDVRHDPMAVPSIAVWLEYFPNAIVHGVDVRDHGRFADPRFVFEMVDIADRAAVAALRDTLPPLQFVIDDGSHSEADQRIAFFAIFERIVSGGYYVIENTHRRPWPDDASPDTDSLTVAMFREFAERGTLRCAEETPDAVHAAARTIANIDLVQAIGTEPGRRSIKAVIIRKH